MAEWFVHPVLHLADVEGSLRFYVNQLNCTSPNARQCRFMNFKQITRLRAVSSLEISRFADPAAVAIPSNEPTFQNDFVVGYAGLIFEFCRKRFVGSYFFFRATRRS